MAMLPQSGVRSRWVHGGVPIDSACIGPYLGDTDRYPYTKPMEKGAKGTVPANMHHFGIARGATIVAVSAKGPFALTYVNPADDPFKRGGKP